MNDTITLTQLVVAIIGAVAVCVLISGILFALDDLFTGAEDTPVQSCVIHPDRWGLYCSAHNVRVTAFDACPHRKEGETWM